MELLKFLSYRIFLTIGLFLLVISISQAQNFEKLSEKFVKSYTYETEGEYTKAIDALKEVYNENMDVYEINLRLGWLTYSSGSFTESLAYYQKALSLKPMSIEARIGYIYPASALGNWEQVKNQYLEILKIDPQNTLANYRLGYLYYGMEDYQMAKKYLDKVVNLYPFDYDSIILLAWTNLKLGKLREAKILFQNALLYNPGDESAEAGLEEIQ